MDANSLRKNSLIEGVNSATGVDLVVTRLAPSPSGRMHAGNIFASLVSWLVARSVCGCVVLRIDNLDTARSKQEYIDYLMQDYEMLGIGWDAGPYFQTDNFAEYERAFFKLQAAGVVYPCFCSRAEIRAYETEITRAPHSCELCDFNKTNICSCIYLDENQRLARTEALAQECRVPSYRVSVEKLENLINKNSGEEVPEKTQQSETFIDLFAGSQTYNLTRDYSDFIIKRTDGAYAYQLACVIDDALEGVNTVVRGCDLLKSTPLQRALAAALDLPQVQYAHVPLICAADGRRLAKRNKDAYLDVLMDKYKTPEAVIGHIAHLTGLAHTPAPTTPTDLAGQFNILEMQDKWKGVDKITLAF